MWRSAYPGTATSQTVAHPSRRRHLVALGPRYTWGGRRPGPAEGDAPPAPAYGRRTTPPDEGGRMDGIRMDVRKRIAMIAHDNRKADLLE